jgi:hypothetical protein
MLRIVSASACGPAEATFPEDPMSRFVENPTDFSVDCAAQQGRCTVARANIVFLDHGDEPGAVDYLQSRCGHVVIVPDASDAGRAHVYHTSCRRMTDVVRQIFDGHLGDPVSLPRLASEMTVGELHRRPVAMAYPACRARVDGFDFRDGGR